MSSSSEHDVNPYSATDQLRAERSAEVMLANDATTQQLGMTIEALAPGYARLSMHVRQDMLNGYSTCHGGYIFTLGDSAFAFACNSFNQVAVAASAAIEYLAPAYADDQLVAEARLQTQGRVTGLYDVDITNQQGKRIALFRGRSHRVGKAVYDE